MAKKIYTEQTEYGQRIVIDYGTHKTVVDVEDGDNSGMGDDRVYVAHEAQNVNMTDIVRVTIDDESYIAEILWDNDFAEYETAFRKAFRIDDFE